MTFFHSALQVAFSVARTTSWTLTGQWYIGFDLLSVDVQSEFNLADGDFRPPRSGIYLNHISAASYTTEPMDAGLVVNSNLHSYMQVASYEHDPETCGRNFLISLEADRRTRYETKFGPLYSDSEGIQTSWTMFRLDDIMQSFIAFSVTGREGVVYDTPRVIPFDIAHVNQGNGWDSSRNEFITPLSGIYFISLIVRLNTPIRSVMLFWCH